MIVAFDGRGAEGNLTGVGKYIQNLVLGLSKKGVDCVVFYSHEPKEEIPQSRSIILEPNNNYYFEQVLLSRWVCEVGADVYHAPFNMGIPLFCRVPSILTVHDIIPLEMDDYFSMSRHPLVSKISYSFRLVSSCMRAKRIITVTDYTKDQLINRLKVNGSKISVISSGVALSSKKHFSVKKIVKGKYILNNGGIDSRKNLNSLIKAFGFLSIDFPRLKLVITGSNPVLEPKLKEQVRDLKLTKRVIFTGYVDEDVLASLIKNSFCICYPSMIEGFGLPVVEGFTLSVPVISSRTSSIPEVSDGAAILVDPTRPKEIACGIRKVLKDKDLRKDLIDKGLRSAKKYRWEKAIKETLKVYKEILR